MGRPRNPNVPEDGYISKRQFDQTGSIATSDFAVVADLDNSKKLVLDPTANDTTIKATIKTPHLTVDTVYTLPSSSGTLVTTASVGPSFGIIQPDLGTSPTATVPADVLTITSSDSSINVVGNSSTKTIDITTNQIVNNYIQNPNAETDTSDWDLYNDSGNTTSAYLINQDLTFTSALSGSGGNGVDIEYIYNASFSSSTPNINVISSSHVQVQWNNGPTIANNPTATQLKAAWDAVGAATAIATVAITGTASKLQYIVGQKFLSNGGDSAPVDGTGGVVSGVTFTRNTSTPLIGTASFDLGKDSVNRQGQGVSTDFTIDSIDKNRTLQISFVYQGSSGMVLGTSSDVRVFVYDIDNANLLPVTPLITIEGPVSTPKQFTGLFATTTGADYRLILHIATTNSVSWDLLLDSVIVSNALSPTAATQVPSVVLQSQPISGSVTDHMCVMWRDGATQWVPATIAGASLPASLTDTTQLGFATNIIGSVADIYIRGAMDGFSFGPFTGFEQYIDNTAGGISPLPSPFTDRYVRTGKAITSTVLNIQFSIHLDLISDSSGVPIKGGLLTSSAVNDSTGDVVLSPGANNSVLVANSAAAKGLNYVTTLTGINTTGSAATWTTARNLAGNSVNGSANVAFANKFIVQGTTDAGLSAAQFLGALATGLVKNTTTTGVLSIAAASDTTGVALTGFVSGAGTVTATDTILTAFNKINGNVALKAPLASPTFTGDVNSSTGNVLISTIGKGLQVKTGTNAKIGTAVLVGGTVTVSNTSVTANSRIFITVQLLGTVVVPTAVAVTAKVVSTSFTITSANATDTSTVAWMIVESIP